MSVDFWLCGIARSSPPSYERAGASVESVAERHTPRVLDRTAVFQKPRYGLWRPTPRPQTRVLHALQTSRLRLAPSVAGEEREPLGSQLSFQQVILQFTHSPPSHFPREDLPPLPSTMVRLLTFTTAAATAVVAVTTLHTVEAHSNMMSPTPYWPSGFFQQNWPYARLDSKAFTGPGSEIPGNQGVKKIAALMGASTVRDFVTKHAKITIQGATMDCGKTELTGTPYDIPAEVHFPWFHQGPCEAWCDDTKIFFNDNCRDNKVGKLKIDQSLCANAKRLQVMYVGVHLENYEVYSNCIPLTGVAAAAAGVASPTPAHLPALGKYGVHGAIPNGGLSSILQRRAVLPGLGGLGGFGLLNAPVPTTPTITPAPTPTKCKYPLRVETAIPSAAPAVVPAPVPAQVGAKPGKPSSPIQQSPLQLAVQRNDVDTPSQRAELVPGPVHAPPPAATVATSKYGLRGEKSNDPSQY